MRASQFPLEWDGLTPIHPLFGRGPGALARMPDASRVPGYVMAEVREWMSLKDIIGTVLGSGQILANYRYMCLSNVMQYMI